MIGLRHVLRQTVELLACIGSITIYTKLSSACPEFSIEASSGAPRLLRPKRRVLDGPEELPLPIVCPDFFFLQSVIFRLDFYPIHPDIWPRFPSPGNLEIPTEFTCNPAGIFSKISTCRNPSNSSQTFIQSPKNFRPDLCLP